ncbi:MAG: YvcK family protein [Chloroflexi bacterium]|nr:YvcK family protein [Chloroflexota bacterium]
MWFWTREALALSLLPGTGLRRWLVLGTFGGLAFAVGVGYLVRSFSSVTIPEFLPGSGEAILFLVAAFIAMGVSLARLTGLLSDARVTSLPEESLRNSILRHKGRERGPRFVAIGGGTGLSTMLRGLKDSSRLTGIVTVADDGGSSGRLREELGLPAPGDIRSCIVALADTEPLMKDLFQYRFPDGGPLEGHSFGNLFIAAMSGVTGSFEDAVSESSRVLNVRGQIVPSTVANVRLVADMSDGSTVMGESAIPSANGVINKVRLEPESPSPYHGASEAIQRADMVIIGPGSLYTSLIPNLLVPGIVGAISNRGVPVVYVCNIASQQGETDGFTVADHLIAIRSHCPDLKIDGVIANNNMADLNIDYEASHIQMGNIGDLGITLIETDLMNDEFRTHHDSEKLANVLLALYDKLRNVSG